MMGSLGWSGGGGVQERIGGGHAGLRTDWSTRLPG